MKYILPGCAVGIVLLLIAYLIQTQNANDNNHYEVSGCWIDSTERTFHLTVVLPDSVMIAMAAVGIEGADVEFVGPHIDQATFREMLLDGIARRNKSDKASKIVGETIDIDDHKVTNGGIFDKDKRR